MKYPRLPEKLDLRKKLMAQDIADIQQAYAEALPFPTRSEILRRRNLKLGSVQSKTQWIHEIMEIYDVSFHTVYYWTHDEYRAEKMLINAKRKHEYEESRKRQRIEAFKRFPLQYEFNKVLSAKWEKRTRRHTHKKISLADWEKYFDSLP